MSGDIGQGHQPADQFQRFRELTRKLVAVPKPEVDEARSKKPKRKAPKPATQ